MRPDPRKALAFFALCALLLFAYWPALSQVYGFREDFGLWFRGRVDPSVPPAGLLMDGRPVFALGFWLFFQFADGIASLGYLRGVGILGIVLFLGALARLLRGAGLSLPLAWLTVAMLGLTLPFVITAAWATLWQIPYACLFGLLGGACVHRGLCGRRACLAAGLLLLLLALMTYQAGAMCFWLAIVVLADREPPSKAWAVRLALAALLLAVTCGLYVKGLQWYVGHFFAHHPLAPYKTRLGSMYASLGPNLRLFLHGPLPEAFGLLAFPPNRYVAGAVAMLLAFAVVMRSRSMAETLFRLCLFIGSLFIWYAPCLASTGCEGFRTQIVLACGIATSLSLNLATAWRICIADTYRMRPVAYALICAHACFALLGIAFQTQGIILRELITPADLEIAIFRRALAPVSDPNAQRILIVRPPLDATLACNVGEFGNVSSSRFYAALGMAYAVLWERFPGLSYGRDIPFIGTGSVAYGPIWSLEKRSYEDMQAQGRISHGDIVVNVLKP